MLSNPVFLSSSLQCIFFIIHCLVLSLCSSVFCSSPHFPAPHVVLTLLFAGLPLSLCDYPVAKLEPAVDVTSCVQAPQSFPQAPQSTSLPLGLLVGMCNRVTCQSVRLAILSLGPLFPDVLYVLFANFNPLQKDGIDNIHDVGVLGSWTRFFKRIIRFLSSFFCGSLTTFQS